MEFKDIFSTKFNKLVNQIASSYDSIRGLIVNNKGDLVELENKIKEINQNQIQSTI